MAKNQPEGRWMTVAVPGMGIRRAYVLDEPVSPEHLMRQAMDEITDAQQFFYEISVRASGRPSPFENEFPSVPRSQSADPADLFLKNFGGSA